VNKITLTALQQLIDLGLVIQKKSDAGDVRVQVTELGQATYKGTYNQSIGEKDSL